MLAIALAPSVYASVRSYFDYNTAKQRIQLAIDKRHTGLQLQDLAYLDALPTEIGNLTNLEFLTASNTRIDDISALAGLARLETLQIANTRVSNIEVLRTMKSLEVLDIGRSRVHSLTPLESLRRLRWIQMDRAFVASLCPLVKLRSLNWLNLYSSFAKDGSRECFKKLSGRIDDIGGGNSYRQNYMPGESYLNRVKFTRFLKDWNWR